MSVQKSSLKKSCLTIETKYYIIIMEICAKGILI